MTNVTPLWGAEPFSVAIAGEVGRSAGRLLTTRLDNDQLLLPGGRLFRYTSDRNPFLSFIERVSITATNDLEEGFGIRPPFGGDG